MMNSIGKILHGKMASTPIIKGVLASQGVEAANKVLVDFFGESVLDHAQAVSVKDYFLTIACLNSVVAQEIKLKEQELAKKINDIIGVVLIKKIKYFF